MKTKKQVLIVIYPEELSGGKVYDDKFNFFPLAIIEEGESEEIVDFLNSQLTDKGKKEEIEFAAYPLNYWECGSTDLALCIHELEVNLKDHTRVLRDAKIGADKTIAAVRLKGDEAAKTSQKVDWDDTNKEYLYCWQIIKKHLGYTNPKLNNLCKPDGTIRYMIRDEKAKGGKNNRKLHYADFLSHVKRTKPDLSEEGRDLFIEGYKQAQKEAKNIKK